MNHDALFKMLLKTPTIFQAFFQAFLPEAGRFVDFENLQFVDKENVTVDGRKRTGDLLIKTRFRGEAAAFLIHLEHQAQLDLDLAWRLLEYCVLDRKDLHLPVYPIAVLSHAESWPKDLVPLRVDFPNRKILEFDFDVIDLRRMDAGLYVKMPNPAALALAARMRFRRANRLSLIRDFWLTLARMVLSKRAQEMVAAFFFAYHKFSGEEALQLRREIGKVESPEMEDRIMELTNPFIEAGKQQGLQEGRQQGRQEGRQEGEVELVLRLLSRRLGAISASQEKAIRKLPLARIEALGEALLEFNSRDDFARWLRLNK